MSAIDSFDCLNIGDLVRWNKNLRSLWSSLPNAEAWQGEPWDCVFSVSFIAKDGDDDEKRGFQLTCVNDCGCHETTAMSAAAYDKACQMIGIPLLSCSGFYDLGEYLLGDKELEYNLDVDAAEIFDLISSGNLPKERNQ